MSPHEEMTPPEGWLPRGTAPISPGRGRGREYDTNRAHVARVYDYLLGGKDNYAADRQAGEEILSKFPNAGIAAQANRAFLGHAVTRLAVSGISQFLDVGTGLPTSPNVNEIAHALNPDARVAYVDNDPLVVRPRLVRDSCGRLTHALEDMLG